MNKKPSDEEIDDFPYQMNRCYYPTGTPKEHVLRKKRYWTDKNTINDNELYELIRTLYPPNTKKEYVLKIKENNYQASKRWKIIRNNRSKNYTLKEDRLLVGKLMDAAWKLNENLADYIQEKHDINPEELKEFRSYYESRIIPKEIKNIKEDYVKKEILKINKITKDFNPLFRVVCEKEYCSLDCPKCKKNTQCKIPIERYN